MATFACDTCGAPVHAFEGERGVLVGTCPVCGRGYGGAKSIDTGWIAPEFIPKPEPAVFIPTYYRAVIGRRDKCGWILGDHFKTIEDAEQAIKTWQPKAKGERYSEYWYIEELPPGSFEPFIKNDLIKVVKQGVGPIV